MDKEIADKFENLLQLPDSKNVTSNFAKNGIFKEQSSIDSATHFLSSFITNAAETAGLTSNKIEYKCPMKSPKPNWKFKKKEIQEKSSAKMA